MMNIVKGTLVILAFIGLGSIVFALPVVENQTQTLSDTTISLERGDLQTGYVDIDIRMMEAADLVGFEFVLAYDPQVVTEIEPVVFTELFGGAGNCSNNGLRCPVALGPKLTSSAATDSVYFGGYSYGAGNGFAGSGVIGRFRVHHTAVDSLSLSVSSISISDGSANLLSLADQMVTIELVEEEDNEDSIFLPLILKSSRSRMESGMGGAEYRFARVDDVISNRVSVSILGLTSLLGFALFSISSSGRMMQRRVIPISVVLLLMGIVASGGSMRTVSQIQATTADLAAPLTLSSSLPMNPDVNQDTVVDLADIMQVAAARGLTASSANWSSSLDIDHDELITDADTARTAARWRETLTQMTSVSPYDGEDDVAVTRETTVYFDRPLDSASVSSESFYASFSGETIESRLHIGTLSHKATLFFNDELPASTRVQVAMDGTLWRDTDGYGIDLNGNGLVGGAQQIDFDTLSLTVIPNTSVCGTVYASEQSREAGGRTVDVVLAGVAVTVDGKEDELFATTDSSGRFCLDPAPAGEFFVHIDGRTVTNDVPTGAYYPFVGKKWTSVIGQQTEIGNIYLPLIPHDTLQLVSQAEETEIQFADSVIAENPDLADVLLTIPADSLFADDGARGGMVGIAPVAPDRLPEALPDGLNFPLVITIQTDGATNFDQPAPICFPNLPDPVTNELASAGDKSALWSFDHDVGRFEIVGPMTVTADGKLVCTDPGVGVLEPGWHGEENGVGGSCPPPVEPEPETDDWADNNSDPSDPDTLYNKQFNCLNDTTCSNQSDDPNNPSWADGFPKYLFDYIDSIGHPSSKMSCQTYYGKYTGNEPDINCLQRIGAHHFQQELQPGFASYCRSIRQQDNYEELRDQWREDHNQFLNEAVIQCYDDVLAEENSLLKWGESIGKSMIVDQANDLREETIRKCDAGLLDSPNDNRSLTTVALPTPLTRDELFSQQIFDNSDLNITTENNLFFLEVGQTYQLKVNWNDADVTGAVETYFYANLSEEFVELSSDGLMTIKATPRPIASSRPLVYITAWYGDYTGTGQFALVGVDSDNDFIVDSYESRVGLDPLAYGPFDQDSDGDGLSDITEVSLELSPVNPDTDGDGFSDHLELEIGSSPRNPSLSDFEAQETTHYYVLQGSLDNDIRRGTTSASGSLTNLILAPNTTYELTYLNPNSLLVGQAIFTTGATGTRFTIPTIALTNDKSLDQDLDGLKDLAEFVLGTDSTKADTDGDGISDLTEVEQGTDPLDGVAAATGIIATVATVGAAEDICVTNDLAVLATGSTGISVIDVSELFDPVVLTQVNTAGHSTAVACSGNLAVAADGTSGVALIDLSNRDEVSLLSQLTVGNVRAVAATPQIVYAGLANGQLLAIDAGTNDVLSRLSLNQSVQDIFIVNSTLYALTTSQLHVVSLQDSPPTIAQTMSVNGTAGAGGRRWRLFAGNDYLYIIHNRGYNTYDLADPLAPALIANGNTSQFGWKQLVDNGNQLGIAAVSPNSTNDGPHDISLYSLADPNQTDLFQSRYETPGLASAVAINRGLAYVADGSAGLQVINYLSYDTAQTPPTIAIKTNLATGAVEESKEVIIQAEVTDDVQVSHVEFLLDGEIVATDGNYPFSFRFIAPRLATQFAFTLQANAIDTGGNIGVSNLISIDVLEDATPPQLQSVTPAENSQQWSVGSVAAFVSEPIDVDTLTAASFYLTSAGDDKQFDTADDQLIATSIEWRELILGAVLSTDTPLESGNYRATITDQVADLAGNRLLEGKSWDFYIFDVGSDRDQDGLPDEVETLLGLNPDNPDTDDDGILDGDEDYDADNVTNFQEVVLQTLPQNPDSDGDGVLDGEEDTDGDGLYDVIEVFIHVTDHLHYDSDRDGFNDREEISYNSDPNDAASGPAVLQLGHLLTVQNTVGPLHNQERATGLLIGVLNEAAPGLFEQDVLSSLIAVENQAAAGVFEQHAIQPLISVQNLSSPGFYQEAVFGPVISIENTTP